jgi:hypothetical protein
MTCLLGMMLTGYRRTKEGNDAVSSEFVDSAFVLMDFVHEEFEAAIHEVLNFLGVEFFGDRSIVDAVGKEDGYQFSLSFD